MKVKKFKLIFSFVILMLTSTLFVACGGKAGSFKFKQSEISMAINETRSISELVELTNFTMDDLTFVSSNSDIVYVKNDGTIVARNAGSATISAKDIPDQWLTVVVNGDPAQSFSAPTNIYYDETTGYVGWDAIYLNKVAANYKVKLTKNGVAQDVPQILTSNKLEILGDGEFTISVACAANGSILESNYSSVFTFKKLQAPTGLSYNDSTRLLTWEAPEGISKFRVIVDGIASKVISEKQFELNLTGVKEYNISVMSCTDGQEQNIYGALCENPLKLTRLAAPEIVVKDGTISWDDQSLTAESFRLEISGPSNKTETISKNVTGLYEYKMENLVAGDYEITLKAIGDSENLIYTNQKTKLNSDISSATVEKLAKYTLAFDKLNKRVYVNGYNDQENPRLLLTIYKNGEKLNTTQMEQGRFNFEFEEAGDYQFVVVNTSKNIAGQNQINSDISEPIYVVKLGQAVGQSHKITNGKYVVEGYSVNKANNYEVKITHLTAATKTLSELNNDVSTLFSSVGTYSVEIIASATDSENIYYLSSTTKTNLKVERPDDCELVDDANNMQVNWQKPSAYNPSYKYELTGASSGSGILTENLYNYSSLAVGNYTLTVWATANSQEGNIIILDSLNKKTVNFSIYKTLGVPSLSFEKTQNGYNLKIEAVDGANSYEIYCNQNIIGSASYNNNEWSFDVTNCFNLKGIGTNNKEYKFEVIAKNTQNTYYNQSTKASLTAVRADAPTKFKISSNNYNAENIEELISSSSSGKWFNSSDAGTVVYINGIKTKNLTDSQLIDAQTGKYPTEFDVEIKYVPNECVDGIYYIDSDFSEFKLTRIVTQSFVNGNILTWQSQNSQQQTSTRLIVSQGQSVQKVDITSMSGGFNLTSLANVYGFDLENKVVASVQCVVKSFEGTISGAYNDGKFVSEGSSYYISSNLDSFNVMYASIAQGIQVTENAQNVEIAYTAKAGAEYKLNNQNNFTFASTKFVSNTPNVLSLEENANQQRNIYLFTITRVADVNNLKVLANEDFGDITLPQGAQKLVCKIDGNVVTNLKSVSTDGATVVASFLAKAVDPNKPYQIYLNSNNKEYSFKRLINHTNLKVDQDRIVWDEDANIAYSNSISFYDNLDPKTQYIKDNISYLVNSLSLTEKEYSDAVYSLGGTAKYFKIKKVVSNFDAKTTSTNYLSSGESEINLKVLSAPTNVKIESVSNNFAQNKVKISWTQNVPQGYNCGKYNIKIVKYSTSGQKLSENVITSDGYYESECSSSYFGDAGKWQVQVKVCGNGDTISSSFSGIETITRLSQTNNVSVSKDGTITWSGVPNASGYVVEYSNLSAQFVTQVLGQDVVTFTIPQEHIESLFENKTEATIVLYAIGNGASVLGEETGYLNSNKLTSFYKLQTPDITLTENAIRINNYTTYTAKDSLYVSAIIDGKQVLNQKITSVTKDELNNYYWTYPKTFSYNDNGIIVNVDLTSQKQIEFSVWAESTNANTLDSYKTTKNATILANLTNLRFKRDASGEIHFYANNANSNDFEVQITIGTNKYKTTGNVDLKLTEEILQKMQNNWTISVKVIGKTDVNAVYIESAAVQIAGTKLSRVSSVTPNGREFGWAAVSGATDYNVYINGGSALSGYTGTTQSLQGLNGGIIEVVIKAVGNVTGSEITQNIVLDSNLSDTFEIIKLNTISNLNIKNGFFTFDQVENANEYVAAIYSNINDLPIAEYTLGAADLPFDDQTKYYTNNELLERLEDGNSYYVKFYVRANGYAYSDYATFNYGQEPCDYIIIKTIPQQENLITLSNPKIDEQNYNYEITIATFNMFEQLNNGSIFFLDGKFSVINSTSFILDQNSDWAEGTHQFGYIQLGSNGIASSGVAYLTAFGNTTTVTKLAAPSISATINNERFGEIGFEFAFVNGANMYYCYFDGNIDGLANGTLYETYQTTNQINTDKLASGVYESLYVKAVSKTLGIIASNNGFLVDESGKNIAVKKMNAPSAPTTNNGAYVWEIDSLGIEITQSGIKESFIENPITMALSLLANQYVEITFINKTSGEKNIYLDSLYNYLLPSQLMSSPIKDQIIEYARTQYGEAIAQVLRDMTTGDKNGFPSLNYGFKEFANGLTVGEYDITFKQIGNFYLLDQNETIILCITTPNSQKITKYIGAAPEISIENNNDTYNLKFTNVAVNPNYFANTEGNKPTYNVVGIYNDQEGNSNRKVIASVTASAINNSETLIVNLTELIEQGILTSAYTSLYVYLAGNDTNGVLNGKCSNEIAIIVLEKIEAKVDHGVIKWAAQSNATKYVAYYNINTKLNVKEFAFIEGASEYLWKCEELTAGQAYTVSILAYGTQQEKASQSYDRVILAGPNTPIGTITKLTKVNDTENGINIINGLFNWDLVANATSYDVFISSQQISEFGEAQANVKVANFETTVGPNEQGVDEIHYYYFMAVGTEEGNLTESSVTYVNSETSPYNSAIRVEGIQGLIIENGIITFTQITKDKIGYKLIFNNGGDNIVINCSNDDIAKGGICQVNTNDYDSLKAAVSYNLTVQAYYSEKTEVDNQYLDVTVFYLISNKAQLEFTKLPAVEHIAVEEGKIKWQYNGPDQIDYHFDLFFSYYDANNAQTIKKSISINAGDCYKNGNMFEYEGVVIEENIGSTQISLSIMVVPGLVQTEKDNQQYALSVETMYGPAIYQYSPITEDSIKIKLENNNLIIDWEGPDDNGETSYTYEVEYKTSQDGEEQFVVIEKSNLVVGGDNADITTTIGEEYVLYVRIRIIPTGANYISSAWTGQREIKKPSSVTGLEFNEETQTFVWEEYPVEEEYKNSFYYRIKDEVGYMGDDNEFVATHAYVITAKLGNEEYIPFEIGLHRVSVQVVISGSETEGLMSDYCTAVEGEFNLFAGGDGTKENPYEISNQVQFNNMKFRLQKDAKNNQYYYGTIQNGKLEIESEQTLVSDENKTYHFKQIAHIALNPEHTFVDYINEDGEYVQNKYTFDSIYDGDFYSLKLLWNKAISGGNKSLSNISIFDTVGESAIIKNINLLFESTSEFSISKPISISVLSCNNFGKIENIVVGKASNGLTINFASLKVSVDLAFIAYCNYGSIERVVNYYNIDLSQSDGNAIAINYATIAIKNGNNGNDGNISYVKNQGSITINATQVNVGALVLDNLFGSQLSYAVNTGNISVFLASSNQAKVGGLIANNDQSTLQYSYCVCDISVSFVVNPTNVYVGGLIATSNVSDIAYSYTNITKNPYNGGNSAYDKIYQLIGSLTGTIKTLQNVYCKQDTFEIGSTTNVSEIYNTYNDGEYLTTQNASGLFENENGFIENVSSNPILKWETDSALPWKELANN